MYPEGNAVFSKKAIGLGHNKCLYTFTLLQYQLPTFIEKLSSRKVVISEICYPSFAYGIHKLHRFFNANSTLD